MSARDCNFLKIHLSKTQSRGEPGRACAQSPGAGAGDSQDTGLYLVPGLSHSADFEQKQPAYN